uniref:Retrotransposon gag domain-containing protein n=1 Tax=Chenopodium quinoa TaxID=63459 RepID=A0A803N8T0_CHEQI
MNAEMPLMKERMGSIEESLEATRKMQAEMLGKLDNIDVNNRGPSPHAESSGGNRRPSNAKDVENFLWDIDQYFRVAHVPDHDKVSVATMYLAGDAKLWWRSRVELDRSTRRNPIQEWAVLKREFKSQLLPNNASWNAREALKNLHQSGSVRDYVKEFSSVILDNKDMSKEDKLFNFVSSLKTWAQTKLRRQNIRTLSAAFAAADALVDLKPGNTTVATSSGTNNK